MRGRVQQQRSQGIRHGDGLLVRLQARGRQWRPEVVALLLVSATVFALNYYYFFSPVAVAVASSGEAELLWRRDEAFEQSEEPDELEEDESEIDPLQGNALDEAQREDMGDVDEEERGFESQRGNQEIVTFLEEHAKNEEDSEMLRNNALGKSKIELMEFTVPLDRAFQHATYWNYSEQMCLKTWYRIGHMDVESRWQPISFNVSNLETNPIWNCRGKTVIPARRWKKSLQRYSYGGFTADLGWPLAVTIYIMEDKTGHCIEFPKYWGHGCGENDFVNGNLNEGNGSWSCFFEPARNPKLAKMDEIKYGKSAEVRLVHEEDSTRHKVKRREKYDVKNPAHKDRYRKIGTLLGLKNLDNDLQTWQAIFHWLFKLKPEVRRRIDKRKEEILTLGGLAIDKNQRIPYAAVHIRLGDKIGMKDGPLEAHVPYDLSHFARYFLCSYHGDPSQKPVPRTIFIATDDYIAVRNFSALVGPEYSIFTSADPLHTGFSITEYQTTWTNKEKFDAAINLWADMEIMAEADRFVGSFQSNIPRMIHLMRMGKPANTTVSMDPMHRSRCSYENEPSRGKDGQLFYCP